MDIKNFYPNSSSWNFEGRSICGQFATGEASISHLHEKKASALSSQEECLHTFAACLSSLCGRAQDLISSQSDVSLVLLARSDIVTLLTLLENQPPRMTPEETSELRFTGGSRSSAIEEAICKLGGVCDDSVCSGKTTAEGEGLESGKVGEAVGFTITSQSEAGEVCVKGGDMYEVAYWLFFHSDDVPKKTLLVEVTVTMLINWGVFAAIIIILDNSNSSTNLSKYCNCQLSDPVVVNDTAKKIRIIVKSVILAIAVIVTFVTMVYGTKYVMGRNRDVFYEVIVLSLGLLSDFVAFLVYYIIDTPSAYFLIVLWFTELLPILFANGTVASTYMLYWIGKVKGNLRERRRNWTF